MTDPDPRELLGALRGARLKNLRYGPEEDAWYFGFTGGNLRVECPWRLAVADASVLGPGDVGSVERPEIVVADLPAVLRSFVGGVAFSDMQVNASGDLRIEFENGAHLEFLCDKRMYENWTLYLPDGRYLVAGPGGQLAAGVP